MCSRSPARFIAGKGFAARRCTFRSSCRSPVYRRKPPRERDTRRGWPSALAEKGPALAGSHPGHFIIGSDQVAPLTAQIIANPTLQKAREHFWRPACKRVSFLTGLAVPEQATPGTSRVDCIPSRATAPAERARIARYLRISKQPDVGWQLQGEAWGSSFFQLTEGRRHQPGMPPRIRWWICCWLKGFRSPDHNRQTNV